MSKSKRVFLLSGANRLPLQPNDWLYSAEESLNISRHDRLPVVETSAGPLWSKTEAAPGDDDEPQGAIELIY